MDPLAIVLVGGVLIAVAGLPIPGIAIAVVGTILLLAARGARRILAGGARPLIAVALVGAAVVGLVVARPWDHGGIEIAAVVGRDAADSDGARRFSDLQLRMSYAYADAVIETVAIDHIDKRRTDLALVRARIASAEAKWAAALAAVRAFDAFVRSTPIVSEDRPSIGAPSALFPWRDASVALAGEPQAVIGKAPVTAELRDAGGILERNINHYRNYLTYVNNAVGSGVEKAANATMVSWLANKPKAEEIFTDVVFTVGGVALGLAFLPEGLVAGSIAIGAATYEGARSALAVGRGAVAIGVPLGLASPGTQSTIVRWHEAMPGMPPLGLPDALTEGAKWVIGASLSQNDRPSEKAAYDAMVSAVQVSGAKKVQAAPGMAELRNLEGYDIVVDAAKATITITPSDSVVVGGGITKELAAQIFPPGDYLVNGERVTVSEGTFSRQFKQLIRELDEAGAIPRTVAGSGGPGAPSPSAARPVVRPPSPTPTPTVEPITKFNFFGRGKLRARDAEQHTDRDIEVALSIQSGVVGGVAVTAWPYKLQILYADTLLPTGEVLDCTRTAQLTMSGSVNMEGGLLGRQAWLVTQKCPQSRYDAVGEFSLDYHGRWESSERVTIEVDDPAGKVEGSRASFRVELRQAYN